MARYYFSNPFAVDIHFSESSLVEENTCRVKTMALFFLLPIIPSFHFPFHIDPPPSLAKKSDS
jgi:hypothetical protein